MTEARYASMPAVPDSSPLRILSASFAYPITFTSTSPSGSPNLVLRVEDATSSAEVSVFAKPDVPCSPAVLRVLLVFELMLGVLISVCMSGLLPIGTWLSWPPEAYFRPVITPKEEKEMFNLLLNFIELVEAAQLPYLATGGTKIGLLRHHSIVPWDDDIGRL
ncbi:unnamed protein product [Protopolystoma xenopodis]|uniref:LicD/FKTN/FKRP nucleotidyltransferase domain-containing protein n=1 Tax=Protopolystoma xenopodis TaxID=117903 RepID=A0A448WBQ5_9PLAT|nr:unnamed protein product [Protopolystoma xenopodis]